MSSPQSSPDDPLRPKSLPELAEDHLGQVVDGRVDAAFQGWFQGQSPDRRLATRLLLFSALVGVVGVPILSAVQAVRVPGLDRGNVEAVFWLLVLTAPVAAYAGLVTWTLGKASFPVTLILAGAAAYFAGVGLANGGVPADLGDLYCFASVNTGGVYYESACRQFDALGFLSSAEPYAGSPSGSPQVFSWAFVYVAEARGIVMAVCGIVAGGALGYLFREE